MRKDKIISSSSLSSSRHTGGFGQEESVKAVRNKARAIFGHNLQAKVLRVMLMNSENEDNSLLTLH